MDFPTQPTPALLALMFVLGLCVGSFLNVVALRSLAEEPFLLGSSRCPDCKHNLMPWDNIPLLSYLMLGGKCRYCRGPIHWQYPLVEFFTGTAFAAITYSFLQFKALPLGWRFGTLHEGAVDASNPIAIWLYIAGALFFASTLIAITITDFREKLIPHEITYPAMIVGLIFSGVVRHDFVGAMVGVGASYILFDFIAFYGLKVYMMVHGGSDDMPARRRKLRRRLRPRFRRKLSRSLRWRLDLATIEREQVFEEPLEVMGGGDAVLSAVMSAFLGWQMLIMALMIGFILGTVMGMVLLFQEIVKAKLLHKLARNCLIWSATCATVLGVFGLVLSGSLGTTGDAQPNTGGAILAALGAISGFLVGMVQTGSNVSKPYPFGPALAAGGFIAIFFLPNWLY